MQRVSQVPVSSLLGIISQVHSHIKIIMPFILSLTTGDNLSCGDTYV